MSTIQKDLTSLQTHPEFANLDGKLNKKLDKLEKYVIDTKKGKQTRDCIDYESNKVYVWKQLPYQSRRSHKNRTKKVSFSDFENETAYDTLATSGSESSPDRNMLSPTPMLDEGTRSSGYPHGSNKETRKKKFNTTKQDVGVKDTKIKNTPYVLRGAMRK